MYITIHVICTAASSDRRIVVIGKAHGWSPQMVFVLASERSLLGGQATHI